VWDLTVVASQYREFAAAVAASDPAAPPAQAFAERMRLMVSWEAFRLLDTGIPVELVPANWPRAATRLAWAQRYNELGPAAEERMRSYVRPIAAELTQLVTTRRLAVTSANT
jgi:phenylacetic acid degradation operon negative regulatory protein